MMHNIYNIYIYNTLYIYIITLYIYIILHWSDHQKGWYAQVAATAKLGSSFDGDALHGSRTGSPGDWSILFEGTGDIYGDLIVDRCPHRYFQLILAKSMMGLSPNFGGKDEVELEQIQQSKQ